MFRTSETVDGASQRIAKTRFRTYPVVNEKEEVIGAISRYHLFNYRKKQLILVDHNEKEQSIHDLEFAEIIEIVDHHRLGGIETQSPISFVNQIVGSTRTIVANLYEQHQIEIPAQIAGVLLAGLLSDTMNLNRRPRPRLTASLRRSWRRFPALTGRPCPRSWSEPRIR